jgi:hypothetical protein
MNEMLISALKNQTVKVCVMHRGLKSLDSNPFTVNLRKKSESVKQIYCVYYR